MHSITSRNATLLLLPFLLSMGAFFIIPLALVIIYSFLKAGPYGGVLWSLSWEGYTHILFEHDFDGRLIFDPGYMIIFWRTIRLSLLCTFFCCLLGFPTAYYMATRPLKQRNLWMVLITIPFWTNLLVRTYAWILVLRGEGLVNGLLRHLGIISEPLDMLYNNFAVCIGLVYSYLPFMILPIYASLERMDWRLTEAARDLYATRMNILRHVIIPQSMPGIVAGWVLVFIPSVGSFLASDLLGGGKQLMLGNLIQLQFGFSRNWPYGSAASVILMLIVMVGIAILSRKNRGLSNAYM